MTGDEQGTRDGLDRPRPLERVAAELTAALAQPHEGAARMPAALAARLVATGEFQLRSGAPRPMPLPASRARWLPFAGWMLAAAAVLAWFVVPSPMVRARAAVGLSTVALFDSLVADPNALRVPWAISTDPAATAATGEVLWDARTQRGVLRIVGLAPNDPRIAQYQLWIIDAARDARYPVDGGVFDVTREGEMLVPITARLRVQDPTLFAVTLERPGGVVVSARERLVLAAQVKG